MSDPRDYKLELSSSPPSDRSPSSDAGKRNWISVFFKCCGVYQRIYLVAGRDLYPARCPRCLSTIQFRVGEGGTSQRQFVVE